MRKYIISAKNIHEVYKALERFFRADRSYLNYHTFTGGFKARKSNRINRLALFDEELDMRIQTIQHGAEVTKKSISPSMQDIIHLNLGPYRGLVIEAGDGVYFTGSKVVIMKKGLLGGSLYDTFQIINEESGCTTVLPDSAVYNLYDIDDIDDSWY